VIFPKFDWLLILSWLEWTEARTTPVCRCLRISIGRCWPASVGETATSSLDPEANTRLLGWRGSKRGGSPSENLSQAAREFYFVT